MGETIHTGTWDRDEAELRLARERLRIAEPGLVPPDRSVPLRKVIEHGGARARAGAVPHLLAFWGNVRLDEMSRAARWTYEDYRREQTDGGRGGREGPATGTIGDELSILMRLLERYRNDHPRGSKRAREVRRGAGSGRAWSGMEKHLLTPLREVVRGAERARRVRGRGVASRRRRRDVALPHLRRDDDRRTPLRPSRADFGQTPRPTETRRLRSRNVARAATLKSDGRIA